MDRKKEKDSDYIKEWYNVEVGIGYQAAHVIRQPLANQPRDAVKVIDMTKPKDNIREKAIKNDDKHDIREPKRSKSDKKGKDKEKDRSRDKKKHKKDKASHRSDKGKVADVVEDKLLFNPILQYFASTISDNTRIFQ